MKPLPGLDVPIARTDPTTQTWYEYLASNATAVATNTTKTAGYESAWTVYTPTITTNAGAFTTVSAVGAYKAIGKTVFVTITVTITAVGTGNFPIASLPSTALSSNILAGREYAVSGKTVVGHIGSPFAGLGNAIVISYDATSPSVNGAVMTMGGVYQSV